MKKKKPSSMDVAKAAGVSQSTVSMILNGKRLPSFTDDTIRRVIEAANALGYHGVRSGKTSQPTGDTILIFCPVLSNPYYSFVAQAVEQAAYAEGFRTEICTTYRNVDIELRHLAGIDTGRVAGIVFSNIPLHIQKVEEINRRIPVVVIGDRTDPIDVDTVEINSYRSGIAVAEYLMGLGHQTIAFVSTTLNDQNRLRLKRLEGIRDALQGSSRNCRLVVKSRDVSSMADISDPDIEHKVGYSLTNECLDDEEITAFIGVNDMVAYGILDALSNAGYRVPEDYSVCGFDNVFPSRLSGISLTSIENFMIQKGHDAFDILFRRIRRSDGQNAEEPGRITRVEYQPRLIIRSSTGAVRTTETKGT